MNTVSGSGQPIYSASNAQTPPPRNDHNIQSLIANQNLLMGVSPPNQPYAMNSHVNTHLAPSNNNPNLVQHHHLTDLNRIPHQVDAATQQLLTPTANNFHTNLLPLIQSPPHRTTMGSSIGGRELDYESPNYASAGLNDYSADRQAEESNRDPGESVIESLPGAADDDEEQEQDDSGAQGDSNEAGQDDPQPETTTAAAAAAEPNADTADQADNSSSDSSSDNNDEQQSDEPNNADEKEVSPADEESAKATGISIDEEVDRMTQPSLGSVSQQDRPFNYDKNTVQFDDSPMSSSMSAEAGGAKKRARPLVETGTLVAQFADPDAASASGKRFKKSRSKAKKRRDEEPAADLQVDHDIVRIGTAESKRKSKPSYDLVEMIKRKRQSRRRSEQDTDKTTKEPPRVSLQSKEPNQKKKVLVRRRRQLARNVIRAPYEIDGFLNELDIDQYIERSLEPARTRRKSRILLDDDNKRRAIDTIKREVALEAASSETIAKRVGSRSAWNNGKKNKNSGSMRRSDEEDDDDSDEGGENENGEGDEQDENGTDDSSPARSHRSTLDPRYHYITSNDTSLQDLLTRQHLLDALRNSQLPAPTLGGSNQMQHQSNQTVTSTNTTNSPQQIAVPAQKAADHQQAAGSLYSVDHGLLLYPASNDDYESKSMSKKKKKHEKKKEKEKMTVAVKKGGHKKKKHKKEEKKFIKEKKFKGAKKGKKVSKGKGGQGGKKGKKLYKDKGFKKKGFKNVYHKEEFGQKKSYFDEFRDKDFKKKWKKFDDKYNYAQMKKWQAKDVKGAKKMKDHGEKFKKYDKGKWKKKYHKQSKEHSASSKKQKKSDGF